MVVASILRVNESLMRTAMSRLSIFLLCALCLGACGNKGALYLLETKEPEAKVSETTVPKTKAPETTGPET